MLKVPTPPTMWKLGRIMEVRHGNDGVVRVASVKIGTIIVKRGIINLCLLPINNK